jgi:hypothetical protein
MRKGNGQADLGLTLPKVRVGHHTNSSKAGNGWENVGTMHGALVSNARG